MPRRREVPKREVTPDSRFGSKLVAKFINSLMSGGKRSTAEGIMYDALDLVAKRTKEDPLDVFKQAIENIKPKVEVKSRRVGGATYQVPVDVRPDRRQALALRWIISFARGRSEKNMMERLAAEFVDAYNKRGASIKKREEVHRMAEANKAFAHYRW